MSHEAQGWAMTARVGDATRKLILWGLAGHAHKDGRNAWASVETLAEYAECSTRTAQRHIVHLLEQGLIREGDQTVIPDKIPARYRPIVYDLAMSAAVAAEWSTEQASGVRATAALDGAKGGREAAARRRGANVTPLRGANVTPLDEGARGDNRGDNRGDKLTPKQELNQKRTEVQERPPAPPSAAQPGTDGALFDPPAPAPKPDPPRSETEGQRTNRLTRVLTDADPERNFNAARGIVAAVVRAGRRSDDEISGALSRLAADGRSLTTETLRIELNGQPAPARPLSPLTARLHLAQDLAAEQYAARQQHPQIDRPTDRPQLTEGRT